MRLLFSVSLLRVRKRESGRMGDPHTERGRGRRRDEWGWKGQLSLLKHSFNRFPLFPHSLLVPSINKMLYHSHSEHIFQLWDGSKREASKSIHQTLSFPFSFSPYLRLLGIKGEREKMEEPFRCSNGGRGEMKEDKGWIVFFSSRLRFCVWGRNESLFLDFSPQLSPSLPFHGIFLHSFFVGR